MTAPITLITGGSRGIGAASARLCARRGHSLAINFAHDGSAAQALVSELRAQGATAVAVQADVSREADVLRLFDAVDAQLGPLTGLVNNAGIVDVAQRVDAMSGQRLARMFGVNVIGAFLCAREALKRMSTRHNGHGGAIVNVSSAASRLGSPAQYVDYAASKGAIDTFTIGLAREVAGEGVRVNAVRPGIIDTEIHASGGQPERARELAPHVPMQRAGRAEEVAEAIVWLLSDAASYTTGALLDVSGGR
jgi:NAD(P)-dependent dehydrogenase (short-subunit alcohol dehydrogenase family)